MYMKYSIFFLVVLLGLCCKVHSQERQFNETEKQKTKRMEWWTDARFGMFIHWGIYALPARHEWVKNYEKLTNEEYQKYFENFNPDLFNPAEWAKTAKEAGMKYAVITTKHHDGFCLFDSEFTDYKVTNTPYGKDIVKEWTDAFRAEGLKVGLYYSLLDWHHPDYTIDKIHPQRVDTEGQFNELNKNRDMNKYRQYLFNQVKEILTKYGKIDILWLDFSFPGKFGKGNEDWDSKKLLSMIRALQPGIMINDRLDLKDDKSGWDFITPEQQKVPSWPQINGKRLPWETCQTFSGSWGYSRDENTWKSPSQLLELLIESVSKGGNLLLNVGPSARGVFDYRANERLKAMGDWMKYNSRSIYDCTQAPDDFVKPDNTLLTYNPKTNRIYVHLLVYPLSKLTLKNMADKVKYIQFLHDASEVKFSHEGEKGNNDLNLQLPVLKPLVEIPVLEVILK